MRVTILGAGGMIGRKLDEAIARGDWPGVTALTLVDVAEPPVPEGWTGDVRTVAADISAPGAALALMEEKPEAVVHLAAIVSGQAEAEFETGYRINMHGTLHLLEAIRQVGHRPRLVFSSSIAVFGAPFPERIDDAVTPRPLTSYGAQKLIGEVLVNDYSRKGYVDGISIRLPTIAVRPGAPNAAASGFFSGILREPLNGQEAKLPVGDEVMHYFASPRAAVGFLIHAGTMDLSSLGANRALTMPGIAATVGEEIAALERAGGDSGLIRREPDPAVADIVAGWPRDFDAARAREHGFVAEKNFDEVLKVYLEEELGR